MGLLRNKGLFCHKKIGSIYFALQSTILPLLLDYLFSVGSLQRIFIIICCCFMTWSGANMLFWLNPNLFKFDVSYPVLLCFMLLGIILLLFLQTFMLGFVILTVHVCRNESCELSSINLYYLLLCFQ